MYEPHYDRMCLNCKNVRIPDIEHVKKGRKHWTVYTCRICKRKDIEERVPKKLWNGSYFEDDMEIENGESSIDEGAS